MEVVLLGHMGRDGAAVDNLVRFGHTVHALGQWRNPGIAEQAEASGGQFVVIPDAIKNVGAVVDYVQGVQPDMLLTNFDDALASGLRDEAERRVADGRPHPLLLPFPDKESARVEWDKFYLRELIDDIDPRYNPEGSRVTTIEAAEAAISSFEARGIDVVIKPRNLTGGKGVKVMGKHFDTYDEAKAYARTVLADSKQTGLEVQRRLEGREFTLQLLTDGKTLIRPPVTYDYPYREDGDTGPGTGGMGTFTMEDGRLPFVNDADYSEAVALMEKLLLAMNARGHDYKGVLYPTFYKTADGLKIVEVNARGGDPELINIIDSMEEDIDLGEVLRLIALGELTTDSARYNKLASAMVYLVSPEYGYGDGPAYEFNIDREAVAANGARLRFAAAERIWGQRYRAVATSRIVGLSALGSTPGEAREKILASIRDGFGTDLPLRYRRDIADPKYIATLAK